MIWFDQKDLIMNGEWSSGRLLLNSYLQDCRSSGFTVHYRVSLEKRLCSLLFDFDVHDEDIDLYRNIESS